MTKSFCRATQRFCRAKKRFCPEICHIILPRLLLRMKVKLNVFSVLNVSLKSCNIYQRAISQNIAQLNYIDLYGIIFSLYDNSNYCTHVTGYALTGEKKD